MSVSVVVPVYNTAEYLSECLDSILAQTYSDLDVVVVDDGSTDGSDRIIAEYAGRDARVRVVSQPNSGVSAARNAGVAAARGEWIVFVDSDDVAHPRMVASLLGLVAQYGVAAAAVRWSHTPSDLSTGGRVQVLSPRQAIRLTLYQHDLDASLSGKLFPAHAVKAVPQAVGRRYEDLASFYGIYERIGGDMAFSSAHLYYYRPNRQSFINNFTPDRLDVLAVTEDIERHFAADPQLAAAARDRRFSANFNMFILARRAGLTAQADACWHLIHRYRRGVLTDSHVRLKNKLGALLSFFGPSAVARAATLIGYH